MLVLHLSWDLVDACWASSPRVVLLMSYICSLACLLVNRSSAYNRKISCDASLCGFCHSAGEVLYGVVFLCEVSRHAKAKNGLTMIALDIAVLQWLP